MARRASSAGSTRRADGRKVYTIFSEWLNIVVRASWAYSPLMPVVHLINIGLSPLLQWIVIPAAALYAARRAGTSL